MNDIALLRLGKKKFSEDPISDQISDERVDLSVFSPACLPSNSSSFVGEDGHVYGEKRKPFTNQYVSISGWGDTGLQETSTDKLQETVVPIVEISKCMERMNQTGGADEDLIVCGGGEESGRPCKVKVKI